MAVISSDIYISDCIVKYIDNKKYITLLRKTRALVTSIECTVIYYKLFYVKALLAVLIFLFAQLFQQNFVEVRIGQLLMIR